LALVSDITSWEIIPTEFGLGEIHVITRADGPVKIFSTLRELMYWAGRADLMVLYGMVSDKYKIEIAIGIDLGLWLDLKTLITAREDKDASIIWDDQDQWAIRSWRFYALPAIHVLETKAGDIIYMFVDKKYPLTPETIQRILNHGLEIDRDPAGRADLMVLYGMVSDKYKIEIAIGIDLGLWLDLKTLITAREDKDASIIWDDQDQWAIRSWRFYALPAIHVLETKAGDIIYMFVDKKPGETLESLESKKLKSSHSKEQPAELQETTSVSAGATIGAGDPIPVVTSVSAASSIPAGTPIAAGVSTTAGASGSASEVTVHIIELLDSPPKDTSIPLDPETK
nr:hypothetical protein [Tanacetum cinerariifolium]